MLIKFLIRSMVLMGIFTTLTAENFKENLETTDIHRIMNEMLKEHIDKKTMDEKTIAHAFRYYIEQFDPDKTYLLQSEVSPYLNPSDAELTEYLKQYQKDDYSAFEKLNETIHYAITRAKKIRTEIEKDPSPLFDEAKKLGSNSEQTYEEIILRRPFAKDEYELKGRQKQDLEFFIKQEMTRFGEGPVLQRQAHILKLYDEQMNIVENEYLYNNDEGTALTADEKNHVFVLHILKSLARSLDSHSTFFSPNEAEEMKVHLEKEYEGVGIVFKEGIDGIVVAEIISGSPAEKDGKVHVDDQLIKIDGKSIVDVPFNAVMGMIKGNLNTPLSLELSKGSGTDKGTVYAVKLNRAKIVLNDNRVDSSYEAFGNGIIGKLTLHSFYQGEDGLSSENDIKKAINDLKKHGEIKGLVLDLRDNSGGYLSQAIKVAGLFITSGIVVISKYSNGEERIYRDMDGKTFYNGPLVVLTSRMTASAAEIVAQALQDYGVAIIAGDERTYGKGSIQSQTVTEKGTDTYFKVTVGKYYTVSGKSPQDFGVLADIVVPGQYSREDIGESFLNNPLKHDTIAAEYEDPLADVNPAIKAWYLKYYLPTLQHRTTEWENMVPTLKKNSEYRIAHNKNYQFFLNKLKPNSETTDEEEKSKEEREEEEAAPLPEGIEAPPKSKNYGVDDLQMNESVNILRDMILLQTDFDKNFLGHQ